MSNEEIMQDWTLNEGAPFGLLVEAQQQDTSLRRIPAQLIKQWVADHRVVIMRGFAALAGAELPTFCEQLGELLEWDFGAVNNLQVNADTRNYLYTNRAVPFHWDGAFIGRVPHYIFFHCDSAPASGGGGETLFCDTIRLLERVPVERRRIWERIRITYSTEKIVHYGGVFTSPLLCPQPHSGPEVLRFAEPVADLNPVKLEFAGIPQAAQIEFLQDMHERLNDEQVCYRHEWLSGDVVIADNFVLLHGRSAFSQDAERFIRRVNIL